MLARLSKCPTTNKGQISPPHRPAPERRGIRPAPASRVAARLRRRLCRLCGHGPPRGKRAPARRDPRRVPPPLSRPIGNVLEENPRRIRRAGGLNLLPPAVAKRKTRRQYYIQTSHHPAMRVPFDQPGLPNAIFPGSTRVPRVVNGVPPFTRSTLYPVGGSPTSTRGSRVLPGIFRLFDDRALQSNHPAAIVSDSK